MFWVQKKPYINNCYCVIIRLIEVIFIEHIKLQTIKCDENAMDIKDVENNIDSAAHLLKSLSNKYRLGILCALYHGEKCVSELGDVVQISQSALSQHLAKLRRDGLVETRRDAQKIYYSVKNNSIQSILSTLYNIYRS